MKAETYDKKQQQIDVLDLAIAVLRDHEKHLDRLLGRLGDLIKLQAKVMQDITSVLEGLHDYRSCQHLILGEEEPEEP